MESKLTRVGIMSEVRSNPVTTLLGISRFDIFVPEADLAVASEVCQGFAVARGGEDSPGELRAAGGFNGYVDPARSELLIEAKVISPSATESLRDDTRDRKLETGAAKPENDLAQATALLEEEVEALLTRESKLIDRCSSLEEKVEAIEQALARTRAELARETSNRSEAERKLTEAGVARASLEEELHALESRLKTSEQALAVSQNQLDLQAQQQEQLMKERREEQMLVQAYAGSVNELRSRVRARLAGKGE